MNGRFVMGGTVVTMLATFLFAGPVWSAMSSTNYEIRFDNIGFGGDNTSSSASYELRDSVGGTALDQSTSSSYTLAPGFREGIFDQVATFDVFTMDRGTETGASAMSSNTVTVNSTSNISVGDMIAIVQNKGANQKSVIGKVTNISGTDVTIDFQTQSSGAITIDGSSDVVYTLDGVSASLGTLSQNGISTAIVGWEVNADVDDGFGVYVYENHDLQTTDGGETYTIGDVTDGTVTVGKSEYGARSSDGSLAGSAFDTTDENFSTAYQLVGSRTNNSLKARDFLTLKASRTSSQQGGSYQHTITLIYVGDY